MRYVGARDLKNRTGEILHLVAEGETVYVTRRGRTVAAISRASDPPPASPALRERIAALRGRHRDLPSSSAYARGKRREEPGRLR